MSKKSPTGCRADQLFGLWLMDADKLEAYRAAAVAIDLEKLARMNAEAEVAEAKEAEDKPTPKPYAVEDGVAIVRVSGMTSKYPTSYQRWLGGTSTLMVEKALMQAADDPDVGSIFMHYDQVPGGTVVGAYELSDRIHAVGRRKPIVAHGDDLIASGGYLFGSGASRLTINRSGIAGSIGTRTHLLDTSAKMERDGVKVIPIASGKYKAAGLAGTAVTKEQVANFQREIERLNDLFVNDVVRGRRGKLTAKAVRDMEARCYVGDEALSMGLVDGVCSYEQALGDAKGIASQFARSGGTPGRVFISAAPTERTIHMDLLAQLRELFGAAEMSDEQAVAKVRSLKTDLATAQAAVTATTAERDQARGERDALKADQPKPADADVLRDRAEAVQAKFDGMVGRQEIPPTVCAKLKGLVVKDGKPDAFWLTTAKDIGARPIDAVAGLFAGEKLGGPEAGVKTGTQQVERTVPGGEGATADHAKLAADGKAAGEAYAAERLKQQGK